MELVKTRRPASPLSFSMIPEARTFCLLHLKARSSALGGIYSEPRLHLITRIRNAIAILQRHRCISIRNIEYVDY